MGRRTVRENAGRVAGPHSGPEAGPGAGETGDGAKKRKEGGGHVGWCEGIRAGMRRRRALTARRCISLC